MKRRGELMVELAKKSSTLDLSIPIIENKSLPVAEDEKSNVSTDHLEPDVGHLSVPVSESLIQLDSDGAILPIYMEEEVDAQECTFYVDLPADAWTQDYVVVSNDVETPTFGDVQEETLLDGIEENFVQQDNIVESISTTAEGAEDENSQSIIKEKSDLMQMNHLKRPIRVKKLKSEEKIRNILKMTDDSLNDNLSNFSSDSDVYQPSSSSSDEDPSYIKSQRVLKQQRTSHSEDIDTTQEEGEESCTKKPTEGVQAILENNPALMEHSIDLPLKINRRKGENINSSDWVRNVNTAKRRQGERYYGLKKQEDGKYCFNNGREERKLKDRCSCKKVRNFGCEKVTDIDRNKLFNNFWKNINSWEAKQATIVSLVEKSKPNFRRGTTDVEDCRKNVSFKYFLKVDYEKIRVCKKMFLNTFCLGEKSVRAWVLKSALDKPLDEPLESQNKQSKKDFEKRGGIEKFFDSLPKMESHYCRANTTKQYLESMWESKLQLFREYKRSCEEKNLEPASRALFHMVFESKNIGFYIPKKDQCETCIKHKLGKVSDEEYNKHQSRKEGARNEKESDKKKAEETDKMMVYAVDVQKVLTCPDLKASSSYYKTKLKVHNYSIFNLTNRDVTCYIWHEGNGLLDSDVFASMLVRFLTKELEGNPGITDIIIWSDGCTYQNRCETVSNALLYFAIKKQVTVYQKYLEVGHTQMEVDSVHSTIEKKLKKHEHFVPADYVRDIKEARMKPSPYTVESLTYKDFFNYSHGYYKSIRPGHKKGDPYVTDLRSLKYTTEGRIWYKLEFNEDWTELPRRPKYDVFNEIKPLYRKPVPIKEKKFKDLQELKLLLEEDYQFFYNNLAHENCKGECVHIKN